MTKPSLFTLFILGFFLFSFTEVFAQSSNKGTNFWLGYGNHVAHGSNNPETMVLYITSDVNTSATVSVASLSFTTTVAITANNVTEVAIPSNAHLSSEGLSNAGINVTSLKPVVVYAHIYQNTVSGATLVLPVNTLGKEYYSINYKQISNSANSYSYFFVVATEDNTTVEITPSQITSGGKAANVPFLVTLNKGQIYQVLGTIVNQGGFSSGTDLTGSKVRSVSSNTSECKKIAVFSGSSKMTIGCLTFALSNANPGSADNLFQQAYPTSSWGKSFVTVPLKERPFDIYRIVKSAPDAVVQLNGVVIPNNSFVNNLYYDFESKVTSVITSTKPIQAVQYAVTQGKTSTCTGSTAGDVGDPEMIYLNPIEQTLNKITMYSTPNAAISKHFINVVIKDSGVASFKLDGVSLGSQFLQVPGMAGYSYAQLSVNVGTHTLTSTEGFNATAYGFGNADSYGYAAGANVFSSGIEPIIRSTSQVVETGCVLKNYSLNIKLPYQPLDFFFDKDDGNGSNQSTPILKSTDVVNGEPIYTYQFIDDITFTEIRSYSFKALAIKPTLDNCGTTDEFIFDFIVNPLPEAKFGASDSVCINSLVSFSDSSKTVNNSKIVEYLWDFDGQGTSSIKNPTFSFNSSGNKNIKLSVKSDEGCWSDIFSKQVYINRDPLLDFTFSPPSCPGKEIQFTDLSTSADGAIISWLWDFGDATSTSTEKNPKHVYQAVQNYNVSLTTVTNKGCSKTISKIVSVNPFPVVDFTTPGICLNDGTVTFVNNSTIADNTSLTYLWDFGDLSSGALNASTAKNGVHAYSRADNYIITLKVKSSITGCETILTKNFTVNGSSPVPVYNVLNANSLCSDQPVIFEEKATVDFGEITKVEWYFDYDNKQTPDLVDDSPALRSAPSKKYFWTYPVFNGNVTKNYKVKMVAYSGLSCLGEISKEITLKAVPLITFDPIPSVCQEVLPYKIEQAKENSGIAGVETFSGTGISTDGIFSPFIAGPGTHTINYKFVATNGCEQELNQDIIVYPTPTVDAGEDQVILAGGQIQLNSIATGDIVKYQWSPSTGLNRTDIANPIASPSDSITYTLEVITSNGCNKTDRIFVNVLQKPIIPNTFTPNNDNINDLWEIKYLDSYSQISVDVFNRYGKLVYHTNSYAQAWDGKLNGEELQTGVYYYIITANDKKLKYTGSVTIIR